MLNFFQLQSSTEIKQKLKERKEKCISHGVTAQPIVLAVAPTPGKINQCFVVIDEVLYEVKGLLKSVDVCFKAIMALNAEYSIESKHAYLFVQRYFYEIKTKNDNMTSAISSLIGLMKGKE